MESQEQIWDSISESWHNFRNKPERLVEYFKDNYTNNAGRIIDLGCGNARNLIPFQNFICYGVDFSKKLLEKAKLTSEKHNLDLRLNKSNLDKLIFKDNFFDYALMLASLHNLETKEKRINALKELYRISRKDGVALITVWNKWQLKFLFRKKDTLIPWHQKGKVYYRDYHLFNYFELKNLLKKVNFEILESKINGGNIIFIVKK
ncbi:MAG: Methyltransferase type 11 [archaeon GW2011_AR20]|nr:MAG: Methyltransferase type 11 [archaeon GW2011_AR20]MBS3160619.1 class I SAM-dependent methyltransferase [Candidatus Woesearchaeota archaeon]